MSIRRALIGGMLALATAAVVIVAAVGAVSIRDSVVREAQARVDHALDTMGSLYEQSLDTLAERLHSKAGGLTLGGEDARVGAQLRQWREDLGFAVLNLCDPEGQPLAGAYPDRQARVPVPTDPVLRRALGGQPARGTVALDPERLGLEGGPALRNLVAVPADGASNAIGTGRALFKWFALPVLDGDGRVVALAYGGRALNHNYELVDSFRNVVFGAERHQGKPLGTVTVFLDGIRVATNVLHLDGRRAVGTEVSDEVRQEVLGHGRRWRARAWVVDAWYLSGYQPLQDPDGRTIGMLYVGLLEAPYVALRNALLARFLVPVAAVLVVGLVVAAWGVRRITRPLQRLKDSAERIAHGDWHGQVTASRTYSEIAELADALHEMQNAIRQRDQQVRDQNATLAHTNEQLARANRNYMETLGFVTHELKAPLAAIQSLIDVLVGTLVADMPQRAKAMLVRVKRNCEELQDMVKNYLDLSRAERGELQAHKRRIDLVRDVVQPCVAQADALFQSRGMTLETACPAELGVEADPELLRIALGNYLSNAAKYGREGGRARLEARAEDDRAVVSVWNEGPGFAADERERLFGKFSRLRNPHTADKRGGGLGLFLCRRVLDLHGGEAWAESEPGQWARFSFRLPIATP